MSKRKRARNKESQETTAAPPPERRGLSRNWILAIILVAAFLPFANTISMKFAYDDTTQILKNEVIRSFSNLPTAFTSEVWFWRVLQDQDPNKQEGPTTPYYRPMFTTYLMLGWALFGNEPVGWHFLNILLHLIAVYFGFLLVERITKDLKLTAIATILFAVHPLRSESVAWISGVTDLFLAVFLFPSFYLYLRYREDGGLKYLAGSLLLFLFAAFSKEPAIALPVFIGAYELFIANQERSFHERIIPAIEFGMGYLCMCLFYFWLRYNALGFILNDNKYTAYQFGQVLMTIPLVICKYIGLLLWPVNLSIFHGTPMVESPLDIRFILPVLAVAAIMVGLWQLRRSLISRFAILWFAIHLLPVLNLTAFGVDFLVQERYVYISSLGFSLLLSQGLLKLPVERWVAVGRRRPAQVALVTLLVLLFSARTFAQNTFWKDDMTLWSKSSQVAADQAMPHFILGHKYIFQRRFPEAAESLERFVEIDPKNPVVLNNLAACHLMLYQAGLYRTGQGDRSHIDRAIALSKQGLEVRPDTQELMDTMGYSYTFLREFDMARAWFDRGLRLNPNNGIILYHKGATYLLQNRIEEALVFLEPARQLEPEVPDIYKFLAYAYRGKGMAQESLKNFNLYLMLLPDAADRPEVDRIIKDLTAQLQGAQPKG